MSGSTLDVLIAEDHVLVRQGMRLVLSREPRLRCVGEAGDGEAAWRLVRELRPDVLLLDLGLPARDGLDVMRAIGEAALPTRVLVVTARQDPASVRAALALGAHGYLLKTDDAQALLQALKVVGDGGWYVSAELAAVFERAPSVGTGPAEPLSEREREIASQVGRGLPSRAIGAALGISQHTVRKHRENIARKLGLRNAAELVAWALRNRL
jgi:DNA-binding NarL/FixJ family response regulator